MQLSKRAFARHLAYAALARMPADLALPILTGPLRGKRWIVRSANYSCWLGKYESVKQHAFVAELGPGLVVFDIGAHVGYYSLLSSVFVRPGGKVIAFEPLKANAARLRRHMTLNHAFVDLIEVAVADHTGEVPFDPGTNTYSGRLAAKGASVPVVSVDELRSVGRIPSPDVMKIDVEGAEADVLRGSRETICSDRPVLFVALHGEAARKECLELLRSFGYRTEPLVGHGIEPWTEIVARSMAVAS